MESVLEFKHISKYFPGVKALDDICFKAYGGEVLAFLGENGYMRVERPDRIILHTDDYRVIEIGNAEKSAFVMELEHFRDAVLGKTENTLRASDAVTMTRLIEEIRSFE